MMKRARSNRSFCIRSGGGPVARVIAALPGWNPLKQTVGTDQGTRPAAPVCTLSDQGSQPMHEGTHAEFVA